MAWFAMNQGFVTIFTFFCVFNTLAISCRLYLDKSFAINGGIFSSSIVIEALLLPAHILSLKRPSVPTVT